MLQAPMPVTPEVPETTTPDENIPGNPQQVVQNYYEVNFWGTCNVLVNNVFALIANVLTTPAGWFGMMFVYVLYRLFTQGKLLE